jgi:hypothetical protein
MSEARINPQQPENQNIDDRIYYSLKQKEVGMNLSDLRPSSYLKKEDVGEGKLVTVKALTREEIADGETKGVLHFHELDKPLVLNTTNLQLMAQITGHDTDLEKNWVGHKVVLYVNPDVSYQGRITGGIRIRAPKPGAIAPVEEKSDLPF